MKTDTIAAIATALSDAGIGIIRISGNEAVQIADKLYRTKSGKKKLLDLPSHTIHYGYIIDDIEGEDSFLDEVMISVMKAPRSYTMEDTVEINCHGGVIILHQILEAVLRNGARLAEPGEFTKRAFLHGRIDLSKAEAVMDLIHSKNKLALRSSVKQLRGSVSNLVGELRDKIIYEIAFIESALDDPEHMSLDGYQERLTEKTQEILASLKKMLDSADNGRLLKEGINTVILGKPNVGKSSLLNAMVGEERAIVTEIRGTTRDVLEESIRLNGISLNIVDTAGIRDTEDVVEKIGIEKARRYAEEADLILYMVDVSVPLDENDYNIMRMISEKKVMVLLNKTDLEEVITEEMLHQLVDGRQIPVIRISTKEYLGMDQLEETIKAMFFSGGIQYNEETVITNIRHKEAMLEAFESMQQVLISLQQGMPEDFYSIDLMSAYAALGRIIGEEVGEDLLNEIFSKFCMGK
ncbi:MAG: tRNA uridine-5-carboxymethylaminomethyl(34) synthesis GTPase MnmE [Lachnospiraceae bacterium]|nr:tRNA uridine-5-carboxymethylaminomethyl(34) synthesis GTPase MnmE [Lachnospiraceae bacterium]